MTDKNDEIVKELRERLSNFGRPFDEERCLELIAQAADVNGNDVNESDTLPLYFAIAAWRPLSILKALLDKGKDVDVNTNHDLEKPLHVAVKWRRDEAVQELLERGADVNAIDNSGETPLDKVLARTPDEANIRIAHMLLDNGADPCCGTTTLLQAMENHVPMGLFFRLVECGLDMNAVNQKGWTPLMHTVAFDKGGMAMDFLMEKGVNPFLKNCKGLTAAEIAEASNYPDVADTLREYERTYTENLFKKAAAQGTPRTRRIRRASGPKMGQ
ncbi:MAG: ankyrin repeat domain-containing protein [Alphaproteobacteria bacterium]|nr:ankyrin repeat domain-containing protein [Alphaproteobacteria bacterium]